MAPARMPRVCCVSRALGREIERKARQALDLSLPRRRARRAKDLGIEVLLRVARLCLNPRLRVLAAGAGQVLWPLVLGRRLANSIGNPCALRTPPSRPRFKIHFKASVCLVCKGLKPAHGRLQTRLLHEILICHVSPTLILIDLNIKDTLRLLLRNLKTTPDFLRVDS